MISLTNNHQYFKIHGTRKYVIFSHWVENFKENRIFFLQLRIFLSVELLVAEVHLHQGY